MEIIAEFADGIIQSMEGDKWQAQSFLIIIIKSLINEDDLYYDSMVFI